MVKLENRPMVVGNLQIVGRSYNEDYFNNTKEMVSAVHGLFLSNFVESEFDDFIKFLDDSVLNDYYLNDSLQECSLKIDNEEIKVNCKDESYSVVNMGSYDMYLKDKIVTVYISGGYSYIIDGQKQYMYYGD